MLLPLVPSFFQPDHYDKGYTPRVPGERLSASYINHYKANGGAVLSKVCVCVRGGGVGCGVEGENERAEENIVRMGMGRKAPWLKVPSASVGEASRAGWSQPCEDQPDALGHTTLTPSAMLLQFGAGSAMADQRALDILGEAYCK